MAGRDTPRGPDPDDWFAASGRAAPGKPGTPVADGESTAGDWEEPGDAEDWLGEGEPPPTGSPRDDASLYARRRAALAGVGLLAIVVLVAGLAASGVFSGGDGEQAATTTAPTTTAPTVSTQPTPTARPAPTATLKPGDEGAQVKVLQRALASLGDAPGPVDGIYGPSTKQAVTEFQSSSGLTADGIFGPKTLAALTQALRSGG